MEHKSRENRELKLIVEKANNFHLAIRSKGWDVRNRDHFLGQKVYKGVRFNKEPILDV